MPNDECPSQQQLAAYALGNNGLDVSCEVIISHHLTLCSRCQSTVHDLERDDSLLDKMRSRGVADLITQEPHLSHLMDQAVKAAQSMSSQGEPQSMQADSEPESLGQYRFIGKLGEGGMGSVYKAEHVNLKRIVALKMLTSQRSQDAGAIERFRREMEAVGKLTHSSIVMAYDAGEIEGNLYLAMEYVEGVDLSQLVRRLGPLRIADACELMCLAAAGLRYAHEHHIVHRDIKPSNIMVEFAEDRPGVKILDLGLALLRRPDTRQLTSTGQVMGTIDYMAPEQLDDSHAVDERADEYSLGATLYKLLTGRAPFEEPSLETLPQKMAAIIRKSPPSITRLRADIPRDLGKLVDRMLAKRPRDRFGELGEVAEALDGFAKNSDLSGLVANARFDVTDDSDVSKTASTLSRQKIAGTKKTDSVVEIPGHASTRSAVPRRRRTVVSLLVAMMVVVAVCVATVVVTIRTPHGLVRIETSDPRVEVVFNQQQVTIRDRATKKEIRVRLGERRLPAGNYVLDVTQLPDGLRFSTQEFEVKHGKDVRIRVTFEPAPESIAADVNLAGAELTQISSPSLKETFYAVAFSPDNSSRMFASGSSDGIVRIWDGRTGGILHSLRGHTESVRNVAWSPNGQQLASASDDGTVRIWDVQDGELNQLVDDETGKRRMAALAWSPNGDVIAYGGQDGVVNLWNPISKKSAGKLEPHNDEVWSMVFSTDGKRIVLGCTSNNIVIWDLENGRQLRTISGHTGGVYALAVSPSGNYLASGDHVGNVTIRTFPNAEVHRHLPGHVDDPKDRLSVWRVVFSPDNKVLATSGADGTIRFWSVASGDKLHVVQCKDYVWGLDWSSDGKRIVASKPGDLPIYHWESTSGLSLAGRILGE